MPNIQPEGARVRVQPGSQVSFVITMPRPNSPCTINPPGDVQLSSSTRNRKRTFTFTAATVPWSGVFAIVVSFVPDASGAVDPTDRYIVQIDDPTTPGIDLNVTTLGPRPGNVDPIVYRLELVS